MAQVTNSFQVRQLGYSSSPVYVVIVVVALDEELLVSVWIEVVSLSALVLSAGELTSTINIGNIITRTIRSVNFLTFITS